MFNTDSIPYVIAEAGVNHNGYLAATLEMIDAAKETGADCVKFQAYTTDKLVLPHNDLYGVLKECELKVENFEKIKEYCDDVGIDFLVTPFTIDWIKPFCDMGVKAFKISSGSVTSRQLLQAIGDTELPVIMSTGMSDMRDISRAIAVLGRRKLCLLQCVSSYPTKLEDINLATIRFLRQVFKTDVGFSDHTLEVFTGELAVIAGATVLEKHFTLSKDYNGPDHRMSLIPSELKEYIKKAKRATTIVGEYNFRVTEEEIEMKKKVQASLVSECYISKGEVISESMVTEKRPGTGISAMDRYKVMNLKAAIDIPVNTILKQEYFERG